MAQKTVYDLIKKQNGEAFAQAVRKFDNAIFDIPNIVEFVRFAGRDAAPLLEYLESMKAIRIQEYKDIENPFTLLASVGYTAVYADTLEKQNAIKPYFAVNEELCTFRDPERHKKYYIVNAVHKDAAKLRRKDFADPRREDRYGTSVMSIQIRKRGGQISIKNRYNDSVEHSDNTYDSNPDNIVPGLSDALRKYFKIDFSSRQEPLPPRFIRMGGHLVKYNAERDRVYYGADCVAWNRCVKPIDKRSQFILDDFVLDLTKDTLAAENAADGFPAGAFGENTSFPAAWRGSVAGRKLHVSKTATGATRIATDDGTWVDVIDGAIVGLSMPNVKSVGDNFLRNSRRLKYLNMPKLESAGSNFLMYNEDLKTVSLPALKKMGDNALSFNQHLEDINVPALESVGDDLLVRNVGVKSIRMDNLRTAGKGFLSAAQNLKTLSLPKLESVGDGFLSDNMLLETLSMPMLKSLGDGALSSNNALKTLHAPRLQVVGDTFLLENNSLADLFLPDLRRVGDEFLVANTAIKKIRMDSLMCTGNYFLENARNLKDVTLPNLRQVGRFFMMMATSVRTLRAPKLETADADFMSANTEMRTLGLPKLRRVGDRFLYNNKLISRVALPELESVGFDFMHANTAVKKLDLPKLKTAGGYFMASNRNLRRISVPLLSDAPLSFYDGRRNPMDYFYAPKARNLDKLPAELRDVIRRTSMKVAAKTVKTRTKTLQSRGQVARGLDSGRE